jgi:hypothetical protein
VIARGRLPSGNGETGHWITLNKSYAGNTCGGGPGINGLPSHEKRHNALHELGHTFGLRHPYANQLGEVPAVHIPHTEQTPTGTLFAFPSVMHAACADFPFGNVTADLSTDDINSMNVIVYLSAFD